MTGLSIDSSAVLAAATSLDRVGVSLEELVQSLAQSLELVAPGFMGTATGTALSSGSDVFVSLGARAVGVVQAVGAGLRTAVSAYQSTDAALALDSIQGPVMSPAVVGAPSPLLSAQSAASGRHRAE